MNIAQILKVGMLNLIFVAFLGFLMRYKIGFELLWINQKNLQLAHSGFAFSGFISFLLMTFIADAIKCVLNSREVLRFKYLIYLNLILAYTTCISTLISGYGIWSIFFQFLGLVLGGFIISNLWVALSRYKYPQITRWFKAASIFYLLSLLANIWLIYMFVSGKKTQHTYLATTYWFLHFQYNGWFFFGCLGLFFNWLFTKELLTNFNQRTFWLFATSCFPAYGLSVLWLELPFWLYIIIVISAVMQLVGVIQLTKFALRKPIIILIKQNKTVLILFFISLGALLVKVFLQGGSIIPNISKLAFGFRPIVIAYLHLVLLAFTALFLIGFIYLNDYFSFSKRNLLATKLFALFVVLNEIVLGIQGIASLSYTVIPFINEILIIIAAGLFLSSILMVPHSSSKH